MKLERGFHFGLVFLCLGGLIIGFVTGDWLLAGGVLLVALGIGLMIMTTVCRIIEKMIQGKS